MIDAKDYHLSAIAFRPEYKEFHRRMALGRHYLPFQWLGWADDMLSGGVLPHETDDSEIFFSGLRQCAHETNMSFLGHRDLDIEDDGFVSTRTSQSPTVYMAHAITETLNNEREPDYMGYLSGALARNGIRSFRPALHEAVKMVGDNHKMLVYLDLCMVAKSDMLLLDLTNGLSFGASVEAGFAHMIGIPVLLVGHEAVRTSAFAKALSSHHLILTKGWLSWTSTIVSNVMGICAPMLKEGEGYHIM